LAEGGWAGDDVDSLAAVVTELTVDAVDELLM
jgi:hypothetical protein